MPAFAELQQALCDAILADDATRVAPLIVADGLAPERRVAIYRNNTFASLTAALEATYPVVSRLVDARFFSFAAHRFIAADPPRHGRLHAYGAEFPRFLESFAPARGVVYLADVARLEWAMAEAFHAADALPLDPAALTTLDPAAIDRLRLIAHPTLRLVESRWPIDRVWEANQDGAAPGKVDLDSGATRIAVARPRLAVGYRTLSPGAFALLAQLARGRTLAEAAQAGAAAEPGFELQPAL
ncbi:MAG: DNA-binding domain-containing protein, partial [Alphaproteobacteria bacterium]